MCLVDKYRVLSAGYYFESFTCHLILITILWATYGYYPRFPGEKFSWQCLCHILFQLAFSLNWPPEPFLPHLLQLRLPEPPLFILSYSSHLTDGKHRKDVEVILIPSMMVGEE